MKISILAQGLESESQNAVGNYLMKFLAENEFHTFVGISAFASEAGVFGLRKLLEHAKGKLKKITIVVGIDQGGTSKEALEELLKSGFNSFIFYYREQPIFHPKIYLFEGDKEVKLIIGSSNLTGGGLFRNVETSVLVEFTPDEKEGADLLQQLTQYYKHLFDQTDPNLHPINEETIANFVALGLVPDEATRKKDYQKRSPDPASDGRRSANKISGRAVPSVPGSFPRKPGTYERSTKGKVSSAERDEPASAARSNLTSKVLPGKLVWTSGPLTQRHLNIPKGPNTNSTGSMLFGKGAMEDIDQRHYFRDEVFSDLPWIKDSSAKTAHLERASAFFTFIIQGKNVGRYSMRLTHNTDKNSTSYKQANSMTSISWGPVKKFIAKDNLIGKSARLFRSDDNSDEFTLVIE